MPSIRLPEKGPKRVVVKVKAAERAAVERVEGERVEAVRAEAVRYK
jgi:hypothetical protein